MNTKETAQTIESVSYDALRTGRVWEFLPESEDRDETWIQPVRDIPVTDLSGRLVATEILLANGQKKLALIGNIDLRDPSKNDHFLMLSIVLPTGLRFHLARYHDPTYEAEGPSGLAAFLGLKMGEVFPINYDISSVAKGVSACIKGSILAEPTSRLSRAELIALAVG